MASEPATRMPSTFRADGMHHGLFRPPISSASSSAYATPFPAAVDAATPKRRRTPHGGYGQGSRQDDGSDMLGSPTPTSLLPRRPFYTLAGQLDTPGSGPDDSGILGESMYSDSNYRRAFGSKRPRQDIDMPDSSRPTPLFALPDKPAPLRNWKATALTTLGDVVGKVWEFCRAGAFRGFYAGGGRGYDVDMGHENGSGALLSGRSVDQWSLRGCSPRVLGHSPTPAGFADRDVPLNNDEAGYANETTALTPTTPAAKRRQTAPFDELGRNWVMVTEPQRQSCRRTTTRGRQDQANATTRRTSTTSSRKATELGPRRLCSRLEAAPALTLTIPEPSRPRSSASFASPRSPLPLKKSNKGRIGLTASASMASAPAHGHGHARRRSAIVSPGPVTSSHRRTRSNASTASGRVDEIEASPRLSSEAKQLATRRKMEEYDADARIEAFNRRLQDMIRQGKEALGTSIEIAGGDGGWEDEE